MSQQENFMINLAMQKRNMKQKDLAKYLAVSEGQLSKWKKKAQADIPDHINQKLFELLELPRIPSVLVELTSSEDVATQWYHHIWQLLDEVDKRNDSGWEYFGDVSEFETQGMPKIISVLKAYGITIEFAPPDIEEIKEYIDTKTWPDVSITDGVISVLIYNILDNHKSLEGYYFSHIGDFDEIDGISEKVSDIYSDFMTLAASKVQMPIEIAQKLAPKLPSFNQSLQRLFLRSLENLKLDFIERNLPVPMNFSNLIVWHPEKLNEVSQSHQRGYTQIHPDIFMNELLLGVRALNASFDRLTTKLEIEKNSKSAEYEEFLKSTYDLQNIFFETTRVTEQKASEGTFAEKYPHLVNEWQAACEGVLSPSTVSPNSNELVLWKCPNGHEWTTSIRSRSRGKTCPKCLKP